MPSLFRFLFLIALISGSIYGGLWFLSVHHEPAQTEVSKPVAGVKIRRE